MKQFTRRLSFFILPLAALFLLLPAFCGCRTSGPPTPPKEIIEEIPPQVVLWLQVIALREAASPSGGAPFPALGFQFDGDRVVPVEKPDTIAGTELTPQQLARWMENLRKAGATLVAAPGFTVGPNLHASSANTTEKRYQANWRTDSDGASAQYAVITPESKFDVQPDLVPGTRALLTSVDAEISSADLDPFTLVDRFAAKDGKEIPLALLLPRETVQRMITQALVQPGRTLILAHYVRQYRSAPQPPIRRSQGGPEQESKGPPATAENLRDHLFYLLSADRRGPEVQSDLPIVPQIPPRCALSLIWLESENAAPEASKPEPAQAPGDLGELQKAAARMKDAPDAVVQTLGLALTAETQAQFEFADERNYVAGIHPDSAEAASPYNFLIRQTWTGMKLSAQLSPTPQGVSAALTLRLADPPQYDDAVGKLPSLRAGLPAGGAGLPAGGAGLPAGGAGLPAGGAGLPAGGVGAPAGGVGAPEAETKEYHFQVAGQTSADFAATQVLQPGQTRLLPLSWRTTGIAVSLKAPLRQAAVSLKEASVPAEPQASGSSAPGHP